MITETPSQINPAKKAAGSALVYIAICLIYIWASGRLAVLHAASIEDVSRIEFIKGSVFVVVTGAVFFGLSCLHWRRIRADEEMILAQRSSLLENERKAVAGMCATSLVHDFNNLLMAVSGLVEDLKGRERDDQLTTELRDEIEAGCARLNRLASRLAQSVKGTLPGEVAMIEIAETVEDLVSLARKHRDVRSCNVTVSRADAITAMLNRSLLDEVLLNLIINAAQATGSGGKIDVQLFRNDGHIVLQVHDNGPGVRADLAERIFDPCFTTKPTGSGLGLLVAKAFAGAHMGKVEVRTSPLGGALFELRFPVPAPAQPA